MSPSGKRKKKLESFALTSMIVLSAFTLLSTIGNKEVYATSQTLNFQPIEYTVPNIYTAQINDLKATFESGNKIRFQGTIKFSASAWDYDPQVLMVNIGLVASRSQQVTNPTYSGVRNGGDVPNDALLYVTSQQVFKNFWVGCTGRTQTLGTMLTDIHPDAQGCELATTWPFYSSGGNQQQRIFDFTLQFSGLAMSRMFLVAGVMDWYDFVSGVLKRIYFDGLVFVLSVFLPDMYGYGLGDLVEIMGSWVDILETPSNQDRGNIDVLWIVPVGESVEAEEQDWVLSGNTIPQRTTQGGESVSGGDAVRLGDTDWKDLKDNQQTYMQTTVTGPGTISFYWKVSSETYFDYLRFYVDGVQQAAISGSVGWQYKSFSVASGTHTLKWAYTKDYSVSSGSDCGWVDWVAWTTGYLSGGLKGKYYDNKDFSDYMFSYVDPIVNYDWSSYPPDGRMGSDTFSVSWTGKIRIDWSSTYTFYVVTDDGSRLWVNGQLIIDKWYDQGATEHSYSMTLSPGYYDIRYDYYENGGLAVAKLLWSSPSIPKQAIPSSNLYYSLANPVSLGDAVDNTQLSWTTGGNGYWFGQTLTLWLGGDAAQSSAITHNQQTYMQTSVTGPGTIAFRWKVSSETYFDYLRFYVDDVQQAAISGSVDWQYQSFSVASGTHTLKWAYTKDSSVNVGLDCGWVDYVEWPNTGGGGGGGGCPTLFVWNGEQYVKEAVIDDHASEDITVQWTIQNTPVPDGDSYKLSLRELDTFTTHIDCVKLYAVDTAGKWRETPLTKAIHSELGNVKQQLLLDDANRVDITPNQTIELKFPVLDIQVAYFIFEINSYNMKPMP